MTVPAPLPRDEPIRLAALRGLEIVDTPIEERFERITRLARRMLGVKTSTISLVEADRQWFKSAQGTAVCETSRDVAFCAHALLEFDVMVIEDAREDPRFRDNPLVTGPSPVVFYAGVPVHADDGSRVGMMCAIDDQPRRMTGEQLEVLRDLAAMAENELRATRPDTLTSLMVAAHTPDQRRGLIDQLTRVWNHDGTLRAAALARASERAGWAVIAVDLDGFNGVNDRHGLGAGDAMLREAAKRIVAGVRDTDAVGRLGDDEFLVVLSPCRGTSQASELVARIRERLEESLLETASGQLPLRASFGVHAEPVGAGTLVQTAVELARKALAKAKPAARGAA